MELHIEAAEPPFPLTTTSFSKAEHKLTQCEQNQICVKGFEYPVSGTWKLLLLLNFMQNCYLATIKPFQIGMRTYCGD